jgi:catalase
MTEDTQAPAATNDAGIAAPNDECFLSPGADGPLLLQDYYLIQRMAHFTGNGSPEHVAHAKGARGAHELL